MDLFEELLRIRDQQREAQKQSIWLIKGKDLPWELNRHGKMRWYLHPSLANIALRTLMFHEQQIPPGSRSGRQKCPGGKVFYVLEGKGHTVVDGVRHDWKAGDLINLPVREEGLIYQHFNGDPNESVRLIGCEPNLVDALSVDRGCGFEELELAPERLQRPASGGVPESTT
ncbi:MAG TPA: cupin domain-containing protein [Chloroflexota bacterium]|nr:cupin domain-containing protein [Chloroflexota bacterium]